MSSRDVLKNVKLMEVAYKIAGIPPIHDEYEIVIAEEIQKYIDEEVKHGDDSDN